MRPEKAMPVTVSAPQLAGKEAYVTISAVDVGILNITRFPVPDANKHFFAQRRLGVDAYDLYGRVIESFEGGTAKIRFGGDMPLGALPQARRPTSRVQTVDLFAGAVKLDAKGIARISLQVPDFNGTLRVSALVFSGDQYGNRDTESVIRAPIVAEASLPRILAPGDRSTVTLDLTNFTGKPGDFKVRVDGIGPVSIGDGARSGEDRERRQVDAELPADGKRGLLDRARTRARRRQWLQGRPQLRHAGATGMAVGVARAHPGAGFACAGDARRRIRRRPDARFGHRAHDGQRAAADPVRERAAGRAGLSVRLRGADHEQGLRRARTRCGHGEDARRQGHRCRTAAASAWKAPSAAWPRCRVSSGHFSMWGDDGYVNAALTPYIVEFLLDAREGGFAVPDAMLQKALQRLNEDLLGGGNEFYGYDHRSHLKFAYQAHAGYVLARVNRAPLGTLRALYDNERKNVLTGLPLVHLGLALSLARRQGSRQQGDRCGLRVQGRSPRLSRRLRQSVARRCADDRADARTRSRQACLRCQARSTSAVNSTRAATAAGSTSARRNRSRSRGSARR